MSSAHNDQNNDILTAVFDQLILALWKRGRDTWEIAIRLGVKECDVHNRLLHIRAKPE